MSIDDALLKLNSGSGDLKKITEDEEDYLAWQAGMRLGQSSTGDVASLNISGDGVLIGTYNDTSFDNPVGSHPTGGTTTISVNVHQTEGTVSTSLSNNPVLKKKSNPDTHINAADDADMNIIVDRLLEKIFANDYPGTYELASSSPGAGYTVSISNIFSDTRADGTVVNYSLYKKTSGTAPTKISPLRLSNTKDGLRAMSTSEIQYTFGQRLKNRIMSTPDNIGTYQLRTSAQGAPVSGGTWVSKGVALDTRQQVSEEDYTRTVTKTFERNSSDTFVGNYVADFIGNYVADFIGNYTGAFTGDYIGDFIGNYVGTYEGIYTRVSEVNYSRISMRISTVNFEGNYDANYLGAPGFVGNYVGEINTSFGTFLRAYTRTSESDYLGAYVGDYIGGNFLGGYIGDYIGGNFEGAYTGVYDGTAFTRNSTDTFSRISENTFTRNSTSPAYARNSIGGEYVGEYVGDFVGNYVANYVGNYVASTIQSSSETLETYTLYVRTA